MKYPRLNNLTDLANLLRSLDNGPNADMGFDMLHEFDAARETDHPCGSACCIGGWVQVCNPEARDKFLDHAVLSLAPENTPWVEAHDLCFPDGFPSAWKATPAQAARAVEILRDTGKCDWERAIKEGAQ